MLNKLFHSNGKLLLTGEYLVIDRAEALAVPTKKGQSLEIQDAESNLIWKSFSHNNSIWFEVEFNLPDLSIVSSTDSEKADWLKNVLENARKLSGNFLSSKKGLNVNTRLEFPEDWGLGSSSTLINNIADWAKINPFDLHFSISNGSGYDIACASSNSPLIYSLKENVPSVQSINFNPSFKDQLFFVYLNKKQNSFNEVNSYNELKKEIDLDECCNAISKITHSIINTSTIQEFNQLIGEHEYILSNILQRETIKETLFPMYNGSIKSLGAWGGDFILATGGQNEKDYFANRGYHTIIPYNEMII